MNKWSFLLPLSFLIGLIILLLPDSGEPVIHLNKLHGPSLMDLLGLLLMLASWLASCAIIIMRWKKIVRKIGRQPTTLLITLYFLFLACIAMALMMSTEWMLWTCIGAATFINGVFILSAWRIKS